MNDDDPVPREGQSQPSKIAQSLQALVSGPLSSSLSSVSSSSRAIPCNESFHLWNTFDEFKHPMDQISGISESLLESIALSSKFWGANNKPINFLRNVQSIASREAFDWLVNINNEILERFNVSTDEFQKLLEKEVETGRSTIPANNSTQPSERVSLQRSDDGQRFVNPLEKLSVMDFVDKVIACVVPVKPSLIEFSAFKLVKEDKDLEDLTTKLQSVNEFAVHLEHNQCGSSQGLTCLMQISTRTEDFIVDTLKLQTHVGPYLREVFKDPTKKKVMHEADQGVVWLLRDFGICLCNLFDTGQASKVLKLEINSFEHLLHRFCGVIPNKEYHDADWGLRPLPDEMLRYAREKTHDLLYIYDIMRIKLQSVPKESGQSDAPLVEVYKRSYDVCMELYQKELPPENGFVTCLFYAGLSESQDSIVRAEVENTGCRNGMDRKLEPEICVSILEFFARKCSNDMVLKKLIEALPPPSLDGNARLKKTFLLRTIVNEVAAGVVSERILDCLEAIERIDNGQQLEVPDSMKEAYCAVSLECTAKYLVTRELHEKYLDAVNRIWRGRIENLEKSKASKLVSEHMRSCRHQVEAAIEDKEVANGISTNTRTTAILKLKLYLREALDLLGPTVLEREFESESGSGAA
ncbi:hypothetical protein PTKIN_Ptkin05aG0006800 [Pterospermum kingtungense]